MRFSEIQTVFRTCLECHSPPNAEANLDLTSLLAVKSNIGKIYESAVIKQTMPMPPFPILTIEEKTLLGQWIGEGMME